MCLRREEGLEALEDKNEIPQWKASRKFEMRSDIANGEFIFSASFLLSRHKTMMTHAGPSDYPLSFGVFIPIEAKDVCCTKTALQ